MLGKWKCRPKLLEWVWLRIEPREGQNYFLSFEYNNVEDGGLLTDADK